MTVSQKGPVSRAPGSQGFPLDVLETKTLMWGGSARIMEAEGTCMISGKEIHNLLPFSDDFRGHFDRMCHARAAILRLRSGPFSVNTPVHAEQFLGLDGEGSITAPAAVRDSSHGRPSLRCGQTSNVRSGSGQKLK